MQSPFLLFLMLLWGGCSLTKLALRSQAPLFEEGGKSLNRERDWQWFKTASPGNIQFMETLYSQDRDNRGLQRALIRSYAGYAYLVSETEALSEQIDSLEERPREAQALALYARALAHGRSYFQAKSITLQGTAEAELLQQLEQRSDQADWGPLLFYAQALAASINLQKQDLALVAQLPRAKLLFDYVCHRQPDIEQGVCPLFYAQYEASRPRMLGGNPEKGRELFLQFIKRHPDHLLARVSYLQFSVMPRLDEEEFNRESEELQRRLDAWKQVDKASDLNLLNATAEQRFSILKKSQKKIF